MIESNEFQIQSEYFVLWRNLLKIYKNAQVNKFLDVISMSSTSNTEVAMMMIANLRLR